MKDFFKIIRNEALRENADMKKDKCKGHNLSEGDGRWTSKNIDPRPLFRAPSVDLRELPISLHDFINYDPNIRSTYGHYTIKYVQKSCRVGNRIKAYQIITDLLGFVPSVSGPGHFRRLCERIPELGWMRRNTNFTDELFGIAKRHPGVPFVFCVDWAKYSRKINDMAEKNNIDIDHKPFVAYITTKEKAQVLNDTYRLSPVRSRQECDKEIRDANDGVEEEPVE